MGCDRFVHATSFPSTIRSSGNRILTGASPIDRPLPNDAYSGDVHIGPAIGELSVEVPIEDVVTFVATEVRVRPCKALKCEVGRPPHAETAEAPQQLARRPSSR